MFLKQTPQKSGIYLSIIKSYRDENGKPKQKTIQALGFLDELKKQYDDPVAHFKQVAKDMTKKDREEKHVKINDSLDLSESMDINEDAFKNIGYVALKKVYQELQLDEFWKRAQRKTKAEYSLNKIFLLLVISRVLCPASKRETVANKGFFFEPFDFTLQDVYRSLDTFSLYEKELQKWIFKYSETLYQRNMEYGYFDCTNYYFEIDQNDIDLIDEEGNIIEKGYRKRGPKKNHRPDPIIEMGLLMDSSGIPLAYDLFPGNESEKLHLRPALNRSHNEFGIGRTIIVADRGLNTSDNIFYINGTNQQDHNPRDGYVYGQSIRGASAEFKAWAIDPDGFYNEKIEDDDNETYFKHKSRIYPKELNINVEDRNGKKKKKKVTVHQKQMVYYSEKYAKRQKSARDEMVARAKDLIEHPKKYDKVAAKGASGYVLNLNFNKDTGEIIDKDLVLDEEKIAEEEKYDGYYSIVTSELEMSDIKIRKVYRELAKIEETFKVTKDDLETRPLFVWTKESIEAHFMTCYTALVIMRLLQKRTKEKYSAKKMIKSMKKYGCIKHQSNIYQFIYNDPIIKDISDEFGLELEKKYRKKGEIKKLLKY